MVEGVERGAFRVDSEGRFEQSCDAYGYLRSHRVGAMLDEALEVLYEERPTNVRSYLASYFSVAGPAPRLPPTLLSSPQHKELRRQVLKEHRDRPLLSPASAADAQQLKGDGVAGAPLARLHHACFDSENERRAAVGAYVMRAGLSGTVDTAVRCLLEASPRPDNRDAIRVFFRDHFLLTTHRIKGILAPPKGSVVACARQRSPSGTYKDITVPLSVQENEERAFDARTVVLDVLPESPVEPIANGAGITAPWLQACLKEGGHYVKVTSLGTRRATAAGTATPPHASFGQFSPARFGRTSLANAGDAFNKRCESFHHAQSFACVNGTPFASLGEGGRHRSLPLDCRRTGSDTRFRAINGGFVPAAAEVSSPVQGAPLQKRSSSNPPPLLPMYDCVRKVESYQSFEDTGSASPASNYSHNSPNSPMTPGGGNFSVNFQPVGDQGAQSTCYQITLDIEKQPKEGDGRVVHQKKYFVLKLCGPEAGWSGDAQVAAREISFYTDVAPYLRDVISLPKLYWCACQGAWGNLLLEDVTANGEIEARSSTIDDWALVYSALAKMHAFFLSPKASNRHLPKWFPNYPLKPDILTESGIVKIRHAVWLFGPFAGAPSWQGPLTRSRIRTYREGLSRLVRLEHLDAASLAQFDTLFRELPRYCSMVSGLRTVCRGDCHLWNAFVRAGDELVFYDFAEWCTCHPVADVAYAWYSTFLSDRDPVELDLVLPHYLNEFQKGAGCVVVEHQFMFDFRTAAVFAIVLNLQYIIRQWRELFLADEPTPLCLYHHMGVDVTADFVAFTPAEFTARFGVDTGFDDPLRRRRRSASTSSSESETTQPQDGTPARHRNGDARDGSFSKSPAAPADDASPVPVRPPVEGGDDEVVILVSKARVEGVAGAAAPVVSGVLTRSGCFAKFARLEDVCASQMPQRDGDDDSFSSPPPPHDVMPPGAQESQFVEACEEEGTGRGYNLGYRPPQDCTTPCEAVAVLASDAAYAQEGAAPHGGRRTPFALYGPLQWRRRVCSGDGAESWEACDALLANALTIAQFNLVDEVADAGTTLSLSSGEVKCTPHDVLHVWQREVGPGAAVDADVLDRPLRYYTDLLNVCAKPLSEYVQKEETGVGHTT
eukprot:Rhum_TRINITY_DN11032_c0_g3::Rhum_TRINITY_DN11032_c0_g3_i1::g.42041::m.42041